MKALLRRKTIIRSVFMFFGFIALVIFGQQCAKVQLEKYEEVNFASIGQSPLRLDPPTEYSPMRRIIFMVDMSQSMISGPCVQDVDEGIGYTNDPPYSIYDPNKGKGSPTDHRSDGSDCQVMKDTTAYPINRSSVVNSSPNINIPTFFKTHLGMDHEGIRIGTVEKWIKDSLLTNSKLLTQRTSIMIIPVSGGISQAKLDEKWKAMTGDNSVLKFYNIADPKITEKMIPWLKQEQEMNLALSTSATDVWRSENRTMGTSAAGSMFSKVYQNVRDEMRSLNDQGLLALTDFQVIHLTDGLVTPLEKNTTDVLKSYTPCSICANDKTQCGVIKLSGDLTCGTLAQKLYDAWGYPEDNSTTKIDFFTGLLESSPYYFGAGFLKMDFVQLYPQRLADAYPGKKTYFADLGPSFEERQSRLSIWPLTKEEPPFRLVDDNTQSTTYKITNFYILNTNVRPDKSGNLQVDSDGDGLFDSEETVAGTDPRNQRTNGICLDSFMVQPAFAGRCMAMSKTTTCDPSLDSDGDSLNECEENLLGTSPYDFDTDSDTIPDSLEWIYGYNPLFSDEKLDSNGDGYLNTIHFASGIGPQNNLKEMQEKSLNSYEVNFKGHETIEHPLLGKVMLELYEILVNHIAVKVGLGVNSNNLQPLYLSRVGNNVEAQKANFIPYQERLLSVISGSERNTLTAIGRMIDVANPDRSYWRVYKVEIPLSGVYSQPRLDLSQFKMIRARDRSQK